MKSSSIETTAEEIRQRQPQKPYLEKGMIFPDYDGFSTVNLPASLCSWLGLDRGEMFPEIHHHADFGDRYDHILLVIVDGLGSYQLGFVQERLSTNPFFRRLQNETVASVLTSIAPSSTASALTSLWTGVPAGCHGLLGYEMWLRPLGMVVNFLLYSPIAIPMTTGLISTAGIPPTSIMPVSTLGEIISGQNGILRSHMPIFLANSNLTSAQMVHSSVIPYRRFGDLWENVAEAFKNSPQSPSLDVVYWNDMDTYNHLKGMRDERVFSDLGSFFQGLEQTLARLKHSVKGRTLVLLTADHGHIENTPDPRRDLKTHPEILNHLTILPCGENRLTYFYPKNGQQAAITQYIEETWPGEFFMASGEKLIEDGLYGPARLHPEIDTRVGELIAIARGKSYFWWPNRLDRLQSRHGGLSEEEMIVPLIGLTL